MSTDARTILRGRGLSKHFPMGKRTVRAVDGVDLDVGEGETLAIVGESGCGKSTTARLILGLLDPTAGELHFEGTDLTDLPGRRAMEERRHMQAVFQDSFSSLDPRMSIRQSIAEPLDSRRVGTRASRRERVRELLDLVGLSQSFASRYPHQLSGGQRQRVGIARALALEPRLIVLDEPVSALDLSVQAQIVNLLLELQERLGLSYLFIAHDLGVVRHVSHRVGIMYLGRMVETGETTEIFDRPAHPYTRALLSAGLDPDPVVQRQRQRLRLEGDLPSPLDIPSGCRFHPRCPRGDDRCVSDDPCLEPRVAGRVVACHYPHDERFDHASVG